MSVETHDSKITVCVRSGADFFKEAIISEKTIVRLRLDRYEGEKTYLGYIYSSADLVAERRSWYFLRSRILIRELLSSSLRLAEE